MVHDNNFLNLSDKFTMKLKLRDKILLFSLSLGLLGLVFFGWLASSSFKKDKLAYLYDQLAFTAQSKATVIKEIIQAQDSMLETLVHSSDLEREGSIPQPITKFLDSNGIIRLIALSMGENLAEKVLYQNSHIEQVPSWQFFKNAPAGLSVVKGERSLYVFKKSLKSGTGFAISLFKSADLDSMFELSPQLVNFIFKNNRSVLDPTDSTLLKLQQHVSALSTEMKAPVGVLQKENFFSDKNYLIAYAKVMIDDIVVVSLIDEDKVLAVQRNFLKKMFGFLLIIAGVLILSGTIGSHFVTKRLAALMHATEEISNDNYDHHLIVNSSDEIGELGHAFNRMSEKISQLLSDLRLYNQQLELKVADRTRELNDALTVQSAMVNSLGQGLFIVDKNLTIKSTYTKISLAMFDKSPDEASIEELLVIPDSDKDSFKELIRLSMDGMFSVNDLFSLCPTSRTNISKQHIELGYAPIYNEEGSIEYIMVIGTDKTREVEQMKTLEKQWNYSQMVTLLANNRFTFNSVVNESLLMIREAIALTQTGAPFAIKTIQRHVHTIKGSFLFFRIPEVAQIADQIETFLEPYFQAKNCDGDILAQARDFLLDLLVTIECFLDHYESLVGFKTSQTHRMVKKMDLLSFKNELQIHKREMVDQFNGFFLSQEIGTYFQIYPKMIEDLAQKLEKQARFHLEGGHLLLPDGNLSELFGLFVHFVRNSMDHGIESPEVRIKAGKPPEGTIRFKFSISAGNLIAELSDDGEGISWEAMARKNKTVTNEEEAIRAILSGGVSSKESISSISGRGVGVSAIHEKVERMRGSIEIRNAVGQGMTLLIKVSLSKIIPLREAA
jgi:signal transduction histidine kinase